VIRPLESSQFCLRKLLVPVDKLVVPVKKLVVPVEKLIVPARNVPSSFAPRFTRHAPRFTLHSFAEVFPSFARLLRTCMKTGQKIVHLTSSLVPRIRRRNATSFSFLLSLSSFLTCHPRP
jgi:hypothetical protein